MTTDKERLMNALEKAKRTRNAIVASRHGKAQSGIVTQQLRTLDGTISELESKLCQIELQEMRDAEQKRGN